MDRTLSREDAQRSSSRAGQPDEGQEDDGKDQDLLFHGFRA